MFGQVCLVIIILLFTIGSGSIILSLLIDPYYENTTLPASKPTRNVVNEFVTDDSGIMEVEYNKKPISDILENFEFDDI